MSELIGLFVTALAVLGGAALVVRLLRSGVRLALGMAELVTARGLADLSARRGDVTAMVERRSAQVTARRRVAIGLSLSLIWLGWLVVPLLAGWGREALAVAAILWLIPGRSRAPARRG